MDSTRPEHISTFQQENFVIAWKIGQNFFLCPSYRLFCKQPAPRNLFVPEKLLICQMAPPFTEFVCSLPWARNPPLQYMLLQIKPVSAHILLLYIFLINPLKPELNPICYLLALLGAHHFLHVSRIRVKLLTLR